jgi:hypothetical protein
MTGVTNNLKRTALHELKWINIDLVNLKQRLIDT